MDEKGKTPKTWGPNIVFWADRLLDRDLGKIHHCYYFHDADGGLGLRAQCVMPGVGQG